MTSLVSDIPRLELAIPPLSTKYFLGKTTAKASSHSRTCKKTEYIQAIEGRWNDRLQVRFGVWHAGNFLKNGIVILASKSTTEGPFSVSSFKPCLSSQQVPVTIRA